MDDAMKKKLAAATFQNLCKAMDKDEWHYKKDEEKLSIECGAQGDDLPIELKIHVDADRQLVILLSFLPLTFPEDKRIDGAVAASIINNRLVNGSFDYDITDGRVIFRMTATFLESVLSEEVFKYLLYSSCQIIDEYNDKLLMLAKGMMDMEKFIQMENE